MAATFYMFGKWIAGVVFSFWFKVEYEFMEELPQGGGYIVICNHCYMLDPIFLAQKLKCQLTFMAKAELFKNRLVAFIFRSLGVFEVGRATEGGPADMAAVDFAVGVLNDGKVLALFPEGTRSLGGGMGRIKSGAAVIASRTKADILPVGITYTNRHRFRSRVIVRYGALIRYEDLPIKTGELREIKKTNRIFLEQISALLEPDSAANAAALPSGTGGENTADVNLTE